MKSNDDIVSQLEQTTLTDGHRDVQIEIEQLNDSKQPRRKSGVLIQSRKKSASESSVGENSVDSLLRKKPRQQLNGQPNKNKRTSSVHRDQILLAASGQTSSKKSR